MSARKQSPLAAALHAGFTLVEVMIALLIGMIGIVVMMQVFAVSEGFKRTATSGTDAQVNGAVAMYMIEREIRTSGYNLNDLMSKGCPTVRLWWNASASGMDLRLVPAEINPGNVPAGDANTDVIQVAFGTADSSVSGVPASQPPAIPGGPMDPTADFKLISGTHDTFKAGDLIVAVQPLASGVPSCAIHELTKVYQASGNCGTPSGLAGLLEHKTIPYKSAYQGCGIAIPVHNAPAPGIRDSGGAVVPGLDSQKGGMIYNLGGTPSIHVWAVRNGNLTMCDWALKDCSKTNNYDVMVNDVVSLRAVYAMANTPADLTKPPDLATVVWGRAPLTTNNLLPTRVVAVAFELVARSNLKEKSTTGSTTCDATPDKTRPDKSQAWMYQGMGGAEIDLSTSAADWNCYRYKLYQTRVPVRNTLWRP